MTGPGNGSSCAGGGGGSGRRRTTLEGVGGDAGGENVDLGSKGLNAEGGSGELDISRSEHVLGRIGEDGSEVKERRQGRINAEGGSGELDIGRSEHVLGRTGEDGSEVKEVRQGSEIKRGGQKSDNLDKSGGEKIKARKAAAVGRFNDRIVGEYLIREEVIARQKKDTVVFMSKTCGCLGLKAKRAYVFDEVIGQYTGDIVTGKMGLNRDYVIQLTTKSGDFIEVDGTPKNSRDIERTMSYMNEYIWAKEGNNVRLCEDGLIRALVDIGRNDDFFSSMMMSTIGV